MKIWRVSNYSTKLDLLRVFRYNTFMSESARKVSKGNKVKIEKVGKTLYRELIKLLTKSHRKTIMQGIESTR